jgi:NTP pyrophosphatase (non-canonical NTP hydrolase)
LKRPNTNLQTVKQTLHDFALDRGGAPLEQLEREFGELFLYLMRVADKLNVDLILAADKCLQQRATQLPVLIPELADPLGKSKE